LLREGSQSAKDQCQNKFLSHRTVIVHPSVVWINTRETYWALGTQSRDETLATGPILVIDLSASKKIA
jgi:hypothetical protein